MTGPDELREMADLADEDKLDVSWGNRMRVAADAWEAERAHAAADVCMWRDCEERNADLRERLEAADAGLRKYGDHMTSCKGNMDAPCTCGYHDVCRPAVKRMEGRQAWLDGAALAGRKP